VLGLSLILKVYADETLRQLSIDFFDDDDIIEVKLLRICALHTKYKYHEMLKYSFPLVQRISAAILAC
jgi:hypothetical protein